MHRLLDSAYAGTLRLLTARRGLPWRLDNGTTLRIDPRCRWIRGEGYEADVVSYLAARIRPGHCCIDVGAHVGFYVMRMSQWSAPDGRVIAFEPNPTARAVLRSNIDLNGLASRVTVEAVAVGASPGSADLFHGEDTTGLSRLGRPNPDGVSGRAITVDVLPLDEYCARRSIVPDWLLIDTEGAELTVLEGAAGLLRETAVQVVVEMHGSLWDDFDLVSSRMRSLLEACGRRPVPITGQQDPFADYGTIALERRSRSNADS
jgi:FkbM family methyltransferase